MVPMIRLVRTSVRMVRLAPVAALAVRFRLPCDFS
jgi:hypothetical protein